LLSIHVNNIGKKFRREWIFRQLTTEIKPGQKLVILGGNGSGKSTLLQILSGFIAPSEGSITYSQEGKVLSPDTLHHGISLASPYLQVIEDFTLKEMAEHAQSFKPFHKTISTKEFIELIQLPQASNKYIREFSSGMKQRLKLGLALLSETPLLLLDEPLSNLDKAGVQWYKSMIETYTASRTVIVCSNAINDEYFFCDTTVNVMDYKTKP
jgi:ABC-type multidrug transport system ATPase subunit